MYKLYRVLKDRVEPLKPEKIEFASGKKVLDAKNDSEYLKKLEAATENIQKAFATQEANTAVYFFVLFLCDSVTNFMTKGPWDQAKFERLLTEWIAAYDQPFDGVEKAEFIKLMNYARHPVILVKLPSREGIRCCVMKMSEDTVVGICEMFAVHIIY
jgi:hypothetical protein